VGLPIEDELIARIINDMKGEPGALPLMQFALKDLFDSQQEKGGIIALTLEDYLRHGGIHKSLERHADRSFATLSENEQELARSIFSGLIEIGRGTSDTRRTALFDELVPANANATEVESVVQRLADARLIITDEQAGKDTVTISHEKLIDAWPWLKKLVNENRDVIALQNEITADAKEWDDHHRDVSYLYTGARLINAREQLEVKNLVLSGLAHEFVRAGRTRQQRGQVALIGGAVFIVIMLMIAVFVFRNQAQQNVAIANSASTQESIAQAASTLAVERAEEAQHQANIAQVNELAALALSNKDERPDLALLLSVEAFNRLVNYQTLNSLLITIRAKPQLLGYLVGNQRVRSVSFSPDGKMLASAGFEGELILWDVETHRKLTSLQLSFPALYDNFDVLFSPKGNILAAGGETGVVLFDLSRNQPVLISNWNIGPVSSLSFNSSGELLAIGRRDESTIALLDVANQTVVATLHPQGDNSNSFGIPSNTGSQVAFRQDGRILAGSWNHLITIWDITDSSKLKTIATLDVGNEVVTSLKFSPDGKKLASGGNGGSVALWDAVKFEKIGHTLKSILGMIYDLAFTPDGSTLASDGGGPNPQDKAIVLWDVENQTQITNLMGHSDAVVSIDFNPNGTILASGSADKTIMLWKMFPDESQIFSELFPLGKLLRNATSSDRGGIEDISFSPDGKYMATTSRNDSINIWDGNKFDFLKKYTPPNGETTLDHAFNSSSSLLAVATLEGRILVYSLSDDSLHCSFQKPDGNRNSASALAFDPVNESILAFTDFLNIYLLDVNKCTILDQFLDRGIRYISEDLIFSEDGKYLFSGNYMLDINTGEKTIFESCIGWSSAIQYAKNIFACDTASDVVLIDIRTKKFIGQPLVGSSSPATKIEFSPDREMLVVSRGDGTITFFDLRSYQRIAQPFKIPGTAQFTLNPKGNILVSGSNDNQLILWDVNPTSWHDRACKMVGRNFTREEWRRYIPGDDYHSTCPEWPP
jgi:WD40 repeat protein